MSYTPRPDTLPGRVCAYFLRNPDEALSAADISLKFDVTANNVATTLADALTHRLLERFKGAGSSVWQYRAGKNIRAADTAPPSAAVLAGKPSPFPTAPRTVRAKRVLPAPLADELLHDVHADVPMPQPLRGPKRTNWALLFERLAKPGLCSAPLPNEHRGAGRTAAAKYRKKLGHTYTVAAINDTHFRIWRTA